MNVLPCSAEPRGFSKDSGKAALTLGLKASTASLYFDYICAQATGTTLIKKHVRANVAKD